MEVSMSSTAQGLPSHQTKSKELPVDSGLSQEGRSALCDLLGRSLANTYVLYHKTHAYHWNVTGPLFYSVHKLTEKQYKDMFKAIDDIAERIRALGFPAPIGLKNYDSAATVEDATGIPEAGTMLRELALDNQHVGKSMREVVEKAEEIGDTYTADFITGRIGTHEEFAWMLNSLAVDDNEGHLASA